MGHGGEALHDQLALDREVAAALAQEILDALEVALQVGVLRLLQLVVLVDLTEGCRSQLVQL